MNEISFDGLIQFLKRVSSIKESISNGIDEGLWWVKFQVDIEHPLVWNVVQEMGYVLNYLSLEERLPTAFKPVSPPPYLNGGPEEFLSWIIQIESRDFTPDDVRDWLKSRLPEPVNDVKKWQV
jgi:hypothetical protein